MNEIWTPRKFPAIWYLPKLKARESTAHEEMRYPTCLIMDYFIA